MGSGVIWSAYCLSHKVVIFDFTLMSYASTSKHTDNANEATSHGNSSRQLDISCSTSSYQPDSRKEEESSSSSFEVRHGFPQSAIEEFFALYRIPEEQRNPFLMFLGNSSAALLMSPVENSNISSVNNSFDQLLMESYREDDARDPLTNSENGNSLIKSVIYSIQRCFGVLNFGLMVLPIRCISVNPKKDKPVRSGATVKHNDPKLYPNILCSICKEWICSRNRLIFIVMPIYYFSFLIFEKYTIIGQSLFRRLHISAHLKYHPYKCDICSYSNRSDILVRTHIKNDHGAQGKVVHETNKEVEKEFVLFIPLVT
uniref:C2H2-type domain-containing protein n=1 Tax=Heterorhabditis bacteriophora TaxID=37862 RepID=A0A1I7XFW2_HETBA